MTVSNWHDKFARVVDQSHLGPLAVVIVWTAMCMPWLSGTHFTPGDSISFNFPQVQYDVNTLRSGGAPWWNPSVFGGQPLLGDPQSMLFTPHVLVGLLSGRSFGLHLFDVTTMFCLLAGGLAMQTLGKFCADNRIMPILAAIVFMIGGVASSRLQHVQEIFVYSLLPLQLLATRNLCRAPTLINAALVFALVLVALVNPSQVVFLSAPGLLPFCLIYIHQSRNRSRACLLGIGAVALALLAASPVLDATLEFLSISNRPTLPVAASAGFSFSLFHLAGLILPGLFGIMKASQGLWAPTDPSQDYIYLGLIPTIILISTLLRPFRVTRIALVAAVLAIFWFCFAMGTNTALYTSIFAHVPLASGFRRPADGAFLMNFSIAMLISATSIKKARTTWTMLDRYSWGAAALLLITVFSVAAVQLLRQAELVGHQADLHRSGLQLALRAIILAVAAAVLTLTPLGLRRVIAAPLILIFSATDLATAGRFSPVFISRYDLSPTAQFYQPRRHKSAAAQQTRDVVSYLTAHGVVAEANPWRIEALGGELAGNLPMTRGLATTEAYGPLSLASYATIIGTQSLQWDTKHFSRDAPNFDADLYQHLGLRYVLIPPSGADALQASAADRENNRIRQNFLANGGASLAASVGAYEVWQMRNPLPKAVILPDAGGPPVACEMLVNERDFQRMRCSAPAPAHLVVGDNDAPGWSACVNGSLAAIDRYKGLLREVSLPPGFNTVTMTYQPVPFLRQRTCPAAP